MTYDGMHDPEKTEQTTDRPTACGRKEKHDE
jgi:hypothetical protein